MTEFPTISLIRIQILLAVGPTFIRKMRRNSIKISRNMSLNMKMRWPQMKSSKSS